MIAAMVLSAGVGTRMRPLSDWCAKPLAPVGDLPALAHVLAALGRARTPRVVVNAHHRMADLRTFLRAEGKGALLSEEAELLGTAGGVARAAEMLGEGDVLVWNGDILADVDAARLAAAHRTEATLAVRVGPRGSGNVGLAEDGRIVRLRQETTSPGEARGGNFLGIHVLGSRLRRALPAKGCLVGDVYLPALRRGARLDAFETDAPFCDIGTIASYLDANVAWLAARGLSSWAAPDARVEEGAVLDRAIVHAGARVCGGGRVARVVVWEGAIAHAPLDAAVVAREGLAR